MGLALIIVVGAAVLARATGGSLAALAALPIKGSRLVIIAVASQLVGGVTAELTNHSGFYLAGLAVSALAAVAFCWRNRQLAGIPLVTIGLVANALVVLVNGAMPVSATAAAHADVSIVSVANGDDPRHSVATDGTTFRSLGDTIPLALPWRPEVISPGDVLIAAGLGEFVLLGMRPRRRPASATAPAPDREPAAVA